MTQDGSINFDLLKAMLRDLGGGLEQGPSLKAMAADPVLKSLLRDEKETNPLKGALMGALKAPVSLMCLAPGKTHCPSPPIASHSIQKSGALRTIADSGNHVLMLVGQPSFDERPRAKGKLVGVNVASTFPGLCSTHDAEIFLEIDTKPLDPPSTRQLFLLSYRSVLKEFHTKRYQERTAIESSKVVLGYAGSSEEAKLATIIHAYETHKGVFFLGKVKRLYDAIYTQGLHEKFFDFIWRRVPSFPIAVASSFSPAHDLTGRDIPWLKDQEPVPTLTLDVVPDQHGTLISLALPKWHEAALRSLRGQFEAASSDGEFVELTWEMALRNCENLAIAPDAWGKISPDDQATIETFFNSTINQWAERPSRLPVPRR